MHCFCDARPHPGASWIAVYTSMGLVATTFFHFFSVVFVVYPSNSPFSGRFICTLLHGRPEAVNYFRHFFCSVFMAFLDVHAAFITGPGTKQGPSNSYSRRPSLSTPFGFLVVYHSKQEFCVRAKLE